MVVQFDERIIKELNDYYHRMSEQGQLFTDEQLTQYYTTFRSKFGPDVLKNLDGETLLETMYGPASSDSLMYWLEFKPDKDFPTSEFGSIVGGSSFKFGLFRKKETGKWTTGSPQKPVELPVEHAILQARRHRDQLLKGVELLEQLPANGSDDEYAWLQREMNKVASDISDLAWSHKYFSLVYPDKLDDFHRENYQRFHLIRLLQLPPDLGGRYSAAGRFVALAQVLVISMNNLATVLNERNGSTPYSYWCLGTPSSSKKQDPWTMMRQTHCVALEWPEAGNLTRITNDKDAKEKIRQALLFPDASVSEQLQFEYSPVSDSSLATKIAQQLFVFQNTIAIGDIVLICSGSTVLSIGRITSEYKFESSSAFPHRRTVEWLTWKPWYLPAQEADVDDKLSTVHRVRKTKNLLEIENQIYHASSITDQLGVSEPELSTLPLPPLSRLTGIPARIQEILERKGQVILYGPPGTGKTYWAEVAARELAARSRYERSFDQLTEEQQATVLRNDNGQGLVRVCSFHPAYGYEDFLEGFRPETTNGNMQFTLRDGIFKNVVDP